jgi:murein DD-endopeptidase MepM/ murein hydrolase activator NlpD
MMTGDHWPIIFIKGLSELRTRRKWINSGPVYAAVGLTLVVAVLLITTISSINSGKRWTEKDILAITDQEQSIILQESIVVPNRVALPPAGSLQANSALPINELIVWPVKGDISLDFGWQRHPVYQDWRFHSGIDIAARDGDQVRAMQAGIVSSVYDDPLLGLCLWVNSGNQTVTYGSLRAVSATKGQKVRAGDELGSVGTAKGEPYAHLHLSVKNLDQYINPRELLSKAP